MQTLPPAFVSNQILSHDALNQILAVIRQNAIQTSSEVTVSVSDNGTTLAVNTPAPRIQVWPVTVTEDGGEAGDIETDCTLTYTVNNLDGGQLGTDVLPVNYRIPKCHYAAGTLGLAFTDGAAGFSLFVCDEGPVGKTIDMAYDLRLEAGNIQIGTIKATVLEADTETVTWTNKITTQASQITPC